MKKILLLIPVMLLCFAACQKDFDPLEGWTGGENSENSAPVPAEVGNRVVAHRGGSTEAGTTKYPDNSRAALNYAIGIGCYASECDIYITSDDEVLVGHADNGCYINNLTPWDHTLAQIRAAGTLANGEELPVLEDFLDIVLEAGTTKLWLDVKNITIDGSSTDEGREASARVCEKACEIIKEKNAANFVDFIVTGNGTAISSTNSTIMQRCAAACSAVGCKVGWMSYSAPQTYVGYGYTWANISTEYLFYNGKLINKTYSVEDYLNANLDFSVYNADTDEDQAYYLGYKDRMYAICTNYPAKLISKWDD